MLNKDFESILCNSWSSSGSWVDFSKAAVFKKKLQLLKSNLKDWRKLVNSLECASAISLREKISLIDIKAEIGPLTSDEIHSCLDLAFALVLINGSPTSEFKLHRGLRQGSLGVYYFSTFKAHQTIINKLKGIRIKFFWDGSSDTYKIPWIAWKKVISSPKQGGLGIGSLVVSNPALLAKWWWRFLIEYNALRCKVIRSIHGSQGGLHDASLIRSKSGPWYRIAKLKEDLLSYYGINLPLIFKKKIGNGESTHFWLGGPTIKETFPHIFQLDNQPNCLVCDRVPDNNGLSTKNTLSPNTPVQSSNILPINLRFNWAWTRPIRSNIEHAKIVDILNMLSNLVLSPSCDI
nr:RNA-directed DNA polymerase, eukaryota, reverse transcriptase zinc-binding domain protein [Tanacetum cinerariifolium]